MPKVSEEHKERRRAQIIEGARRCFARYGYEGATVARLEEETGLSRGAIFNYFENKEALFVAVASELSDRMTKIWLEEGFRALLEAVVHEDTDWLAVQAEATRRSPPPPPYPPPPPAQVAVPRAARAPRLEALRAQGVRADVGIDQVAIFLSLVANGLALRITAGDEPPDLDAIAELVDHGVAPRQSREPRPRTAPRRSVRTARRS